MANVHLVFAISKIPKIKFIFFAVNLIGYATISVELPSLFGHRFPISLAFGSFLFSNIARCSLRCHNLIHLSLHFAWCFVVRMLRREYLLLFARVEAENLLLGFGGAALALGNGFGGVAARILALAHLHGGAAAVPAQRWQVVVPERVGWRQRGAVQDGVLLAHAVVNGK